MVSVKLEWIKKKEKYEGHIAGRLIMEELHGTYGELSIWGMGMADRRV
jgi:hypothetical protein